MSSPATKKRKLTRRSVVAINLPNRTIPPTPSPDDEDEAEKQPPATICLVVEGSNDRFKCHVEALRQSSYFAKYIPEVLTKAAEVILTVPATLVVRDLEVALAYLHRDLNDCDISIPGFLGTRGNLPFHRLLDSYKIAQTFGLESWANALIDVYCNNLRRHSNYSGFLGIATLPLKKSPLMQLLLEHIAWEIRTKGFDWSKILSKNRAENSEYARDPDVVISVVNFIAQTTGGLHPLDRWDRCRWHVHEVTEKCITTKPMN